MEWQELTDLQEKIDKLGLVRPKQRPFWWCRWFHRRRWAFGVSVGGTDPHMYYYCGICAREIR